MSSRSLTLAGAFGCWLLIGAGLQGCASKGDVQAVQSEVILLKAESSRRDSARAAQLAQVLELQQRIMDSLTASRRAMAQFKGDLATDLYNIQQQLVQLQELTGQSQQRLTQLKAQIDTRAEQAEASGAVRPAPGDSAARTAAPPAPSADQMYRSARDQHGRGALATARMAYQELVKNYPADPRVPDALFYIGETFASEAPDSAVAYYGQVVARFRTSPRAPMALYRLGRLEEARRNPAAARGYYDRLIRDYPTSDDADLARDRLKTLRP